MYIISGQTYYSESEPILSAGIISGSYVKGNGSLLTNLPGRLSTEDVTLTENTGIVYNPSLSADGKYMGLVISGVAGDVLAFGDIIHLSAIDSRWELADANSASGAVGDCRGIIGICVLAAAGNGSATKILLNGIVRADAKFPALVLNGPVFISETAGVVTNTAPSTTDAIIRVLGFGLTADEMYFNPSSDWLTSV